MKTEFLKININPEWKDLVDEFPEFIFDLSPHLLKLVDENPDHFDSKENLCNLRYSFEFGIGWKNLVRNHFTEIKKLILKAKENGHDLDYRPFILKEKMGTLRDQGFWYGKDKDLYSTDINLILSKVYAESMKTCEVTGEDASLCHSGRGWYKTLSDKMIKENYNNTEWVKI